MRNWADTNSGRVTRQPLVGDGFVGPESMPDRCGECGLMLAMRNWALPMTGSYCQRQQNRYELG